MSEKHSQDRPDAKHKSEKGEFRHKPDGGNSHRDKVREVSERIRDKNRDILNRLAKK